MIRIRSNLIPAARVLLVASIVSASIFVAARIRIAHVSSTVNHESASVTPIRGPVQVVRFTLYDIGIYPQEARAKQGMVTISIEDLSGNSPGLIIERVEQASRVPAGLVSKATNRLRSRTELFLPQGRYEVVDANRRDNRAALIVEP